MQGQKVIRLLVRQIKGVRKVEILARPVLNEVAGPNGAGKSSVLDAIVWAFSGKRAIDSKPLRDGAGKGEIVVETEELTVTRRFSENGDTRLTVTAKDGGKLGQRELDGLLSRFSFDPLAFSRAPAAEQVTILQGLIGAEFSEQLKALDAQIEAAATERTLANRELTRFGAVPEVPAAESVDLAALQAELEEVQAWNKAQDARHTARAQKEADIRANVEMIAQFVAQIEELQRRVEQRKSYGSTLEAQLRELPKCEPPQDEAPIRARFSAAAEQNAAAQAFETYKRRVHERAELAREVNRAEEQLEALRAERAELQAGAQLPIEGVSFGDAGLRVRGIPFEQLSSSERIRISARIGMAATAGLRVMFCKDGSLLDQQSFAELVALAEEHGVQLWVETVGEGHGDAILLEAGEVVAPEVPIESGAAEAF